MPETCGDWMDGCECGKQSERAGETKKVASYLGLNPSEESSGRTVAHGSDQQVRQHAAALVSKNSDARSEARNLFAMIGRNRDPSIPFAS